MGGGEEKERERREEGRILGEREGKEGGREESGRKGGKRGRKGGLGWELPGESGERRRSRKDEVVDESEVKAWKVGMCERSSHKV